MLSRQESDEVEDEIVMTNLLTTLRDHCPEVITNAKLRSKSILNMYLSPPPTSSSTTVSSRKESTSSRACSSLDESQPKRTLVDAVVIPPLKSRVIQAKSTAGGEATAGRGAKRKTRASTVLDEDDTNDKDYYDLGTVEGAKRRRAAEQRIVTLETRRHDQESKANTLDKQHHPTPSRTRRKRAPAPKRKAHVARTWIPKKKPVFNCGSSDEGGIKPGSKPKKGSPTSAPPILAPKTPRVQQSSCPEPDTLSSDLAQSASTRVGSDLISGHPTTFEYAACHAGSRSPENCFGRSLSESLSTDQTTPRPADANSDDHGVKNEMTLNGKDQSRSWTIFESMTVFGLSRFFGPRLDIASALQVFTMTERDQERDDADGGQARRTWHRSPSEIADELQRLQTILSSTHSFSNPILEPESSPQDVLAKKLYQLWQGRGDPGIVYPGIDQGEEIEANEAYESRLFPEPTVDQLLKRMLMADVEAEERNTDGPEGRRGGELKEDKLNLSMWEQLATEDSALLAKTGQADQKGHVSVATDTAPTIKDKKASYFDPVPPLALAVKRVRFRSVRQMVRENRKKEQEEKSRMVAYGGQR